MEQPLKPLADYLIKDSLNAIDRTEKEIQQVYIVQRKQMIRNAVFAGLFVIAALAVIGFLLVTK